MTIEVSSINGITIITHKEKILNHYWLELAYNTLQDEVIRNRKNKVICDMSQVEKSVLTESDFEEIQPAMLYIAENAPENTTIAVAVKDENTTRLLNDCRSKLNEISDVSIVCSIVPSIEDALGVF